jgi:hypothetical protein
VPCVILWPKAARFMSATLMGDSASAAEKRYAYVAYVRRSLFLEGRMLLISRGPSTIPAMFVVFALGLFIHADPRAETYPIPNVSSRVLLVLSQLATRTGEATGMPPWSHTPTGARVDGAGRLEVMIQTTETTAEVLKELETRGSSIEIYDAAQNLVQAWISPERIREIAALPFVRFLDLPNYGVTDRLRE